jgi:hypothetical protein
VDALMPLCLHFCAIGGAALSICVMPRTRSLVVCLLLGVILVAGVVCGFCVTHRRTPRPFYQGKPLEYWFNQLPMTRMGATGSNPKAMLSDRWRCQAPSGAVRKWGSWLEKPQDSGNAIRGIGSNAFAFYIRKVRRHIGAPEMQIMKVARAVGFHGFLFQDVEPEREQAVTALILLKPLPPLVVSELVALSTNRDPYICGAALCALQTNEKELLFLHPPESKDSIDADLYRIPIPADFP